MENSTIKDIGQLNVPGVSEKMVPDWNRRLARELKKMN